MMPKLNKKLIVILVISVSVITGVYIMYEDGNPDSIINETDTVEGTGVMDMRAKLQRKNVGILMIEIDSTGEVDVRSGNTWVESLIVEYKLEKSKIYENYNPNVMVHLTIKNNEEVLYDDDKCSYLTKGDAGELQKMVFENLDHIRNGIFDADATLKVYY